MNGDKGSFLWEIACEEIPARMLPEAVTELKSRMEAALREARLAFSTVESHGTPRRLALFVTGLPEQQPDREEPRRGPPADRAFTPDGQPTPAATGFAKSCHTTVDQLERLETPKGAYLGFTVRLPGQAAAQVLSEIMGRILNEFPWPKSMRWGSGSATFVRPVHAVTALLDGQSIPLPPETLDGLTVGNRVEGHRFMGRGPHWVTGIHHYQETLAQNRVILDIAHREKKIRDGVHQLAAEAGGVAVLDPGLVSENACLTEWPVPLLGRFDAKYLDIPREVLITSMKNHQKYFPVHDGQGKLLPCFVAVSNMEVPDPSVLVRGYQRVLKARLEDAAFYWDEDRKVPLPERVQELDRVVFQARLGSLGEKTRRLANLTTPLAWVVDPAAAGSAQRAAELCKCDLVTGLVGEFPELQGVMGGYYALAAGESDVVVLAIREHYLPQGPSDPLPRSTEGVIVALADKLDTLTGCFGVGLTPTGNKDPFALRRAALGVIRIALTKQLRLPLRELIGFAHRQYPEGVLEWGESQTVGELLDFFYGRLEAHLRAEGLEPDLIAAVQALGLDDMLDVTRRVQALATFRDLPSYTALVAANKRIANLLEKAGEEAHAVGPVESSRFVDPAEHHLHAEVQAAAEAASALVNAGEYAHALERLAKLREPIDAFFAAVMVMVEESAQRRNRLALLVSVRAAFRLTADISRLSLPESA
ncbi:MAG: glycine--tRNA ligase subunit beta [Magnetococcales bacterium]|nr:glycine--tRNA ligase subunit beta [Magnetococcales bacterium]